MVDESHRHAALTSSENFEVGSNSGWVENYYSERTRRKSASDAALLKSRSKEFQPFMSTPIKSEGRRGGGGGGKKKHVSSSRLDFMSDRPQGIPEEEGGGGGDRGEGEGSGDSLSGSASTSTVIGSSSASSSVASGSPKKSESNPSACITTRSST